MPASVHCMASRSGNLGANNALVEELHGQLDGRDHLGGIMEGERAGLPGRVAFGHVHEQVWLSPAIVLVVKVRDGGGSRMWLHNGLGIL
jgi:hypothetical protein